MFQRLALRPSFQINRRGSKSPLHLALTAPDTIERQKGAAKLEQLYPASKGEHILLRYLPVLANDGTWFEADDDILDWMSELEQQNSHGGIPSRTAMLPIKTCIPTQDNVERPGLLQYLTGKTPFKHTTITKLKNKLYINDGHHNLVATALCGETQAECLIYDHDKV